MLGNHKIVKQALGNKHQRRQNDTESKAVTFVNAGLTKMKVQGTFMLLQVISLRRNKFFLVYFEMKVKLQVKVV